MPLQCTGTCSLVNKLLKVKYSCGGKCLVRKSKKFEVNIGKRLHYATLPGADDGSKKLVGFSSISGCPPQALSQDDPFPSNSRNNLPLPIYPLISLLFIYHQLF